MIGVESTVIRLTEDGCILLRPGEILPRELASVVENVHISPAVLDPEAAGDHPQSSRYEIPALCSKDATHSCGCCCRRICGVCKWTGRCLRRFGIYGGFKSVPRQEGDGTWVKKRSFRADAQSVSNPAGGRYLAGAGDICTAAAENGRISCTLQPHYSGGRM